MARVNNNTNTCFVCGKEYDYCPHCSLVQPDYNAARFCSKEHSEMFAILSKHGCHLATAEETLDALKGYDTRNLTEPIQNHINSLLPKKVEVVAKVKPKVVKEVEVSNDTRAQE